MGFVEAGTNKGFDVDLARYIAKELGYAGEDKIEWVEITKVADRVTFLEQGKVDLVFASFSITKARMEHVRFAGPYMVTEQSVLIPAEMKGKISTIEDLKNPAHKVCTATGSTSERLLRDRDIHAISLDNDEACFGGVRKGTFQAMSTDRTVLFGFVSQFPKQFTVLDVALATADNAGVERLGIGVSKNNPALQDLVNYFLNKSYLAQQAGDPTEWRTAFNRYLGPWYGPLTQPPPDNVPDLLDFDAKAPSR
jgi:glutamate transport system substrate-binding protein